MQVRHRGQHDIVEFRSLLQAKTGKMSSERPVVVRLSRHCKHQNECASHDHAVTGSAHSNSEAYREKESGQLTKYSAQLNHHSLACKRARLTKISMADDGLTDGFRLIFRGADVAEKSQCFEGAIVLERHTYAVCSRVLCQDRGAGMSCSMSRA